MDANTTREELNDRLNQVGNDVREMSRNVWLAGLGAIGTIDERGRAVFNDLVGRGEKMDGKLDLEIMKPFGGAADRVKSFNEDIERRVEDGMETALHRLGMPTRGDVSTLIERVEQLTQKVEGLSAS